jgi:FMN phosphatase YigB (HAD superfamily)
MLAHEDQQNILIVDYGGVVADHYQEPAENTLSDIIGVSRSDLRGLLSERSKQGAAFRKAEITENEFWHRVFNLTGFTGEIPDCAYLSQLWSETYQINKKTFDIIQLARKNVKFGILTNIDEARSRYLVDKIEICNWTDFYFPSYKFRCIKPSPSIFFKVEEIIVSYEKKPIIFYVDDRESHVIAASECGWRGIQYSSPENLYNDLKLHGLISGDKII